MGKKPFRERARAALAALRGRNVSAKSDATATTAIAAPPPVKAATRTRMPARMVQSSYRGAESSRITADVISRAVSPVEQLRSDLKILRARARDLSRNDPLAKNFLNLAVVHVLGSQGPRLQAQVRLPDGELDVATNRKIEQAWGEWCRSRVTVDGRMNFSQFQQQSFRTMVADGESFTRPIFGADRPHGLALQGIDPDLVDETLTLLSGRDGTEIWLGVEVNRDAAPIAYHVYDGLYSESYYAKQRKRIAADQMLHSFVSERFNQARGVTWFAPVMIPLLELNGYIEAVLVGARAGASQMAFVETSEDSPSAYVPEQEGGAEADQQQPQPAETETSPGMVTRLAPGEKAVPFMPSQPTDLVGDFTMLISRLVGSGLGVGYAPLTGDYSQTSYSSERAATLVQREVWSWLQDMWIAQFTQPIYEWWLEAAILSGVLRLGSYDPKRFARARWLTHGWPWIDPLKDLQASHLELSLGLTSVTRTLADRGIDLEELLEEIRDERALGLKYGVDFEKLIAETGSKGSPSVSTDPAGDGSDGSGDEPAPKGKEGNSAIGRQVGRSRIATALNGTTKH